MPTSVPSKSESDEGINGNIITTTATKYSSELSTETNAIGIIVGVAVVCIVIP